MPTDAVNDGVLQVVQAYCRAAFELRRGVCLLNVGQYDKAIAAFSKAASHGYTGAGLPSYMAACFLGQNNPQAAAEQFARAQADGTAYGGTAYRDSAGGDPAPGAWADDPAGSDPAPGAWADDPAGSTPAGGELFRPSPAPAGRAESVAMPRSFRASSSGSMLLLARMQPSQRTCPMQPSCPDRRPNTSRTLHPSSV